MRVTIKDVARAAGVSVTTVSYVLSRRPGVSISQSTADRVLREARRLDYRHNAIAADLRRGATRLVGVQLYSLGVPILARKVAALEQSLRAAGFYPFLCHALDVDSERSFYHECASRRVRGVILTSPPSEAARSDIRQLLAHRMPVISMEPVPELGLPYITVDRAGAAQIAVNHLLALGHRRVAAVSGYTGLANLDYVSAFGSALEANGISSDPRFILNIVPLTPHYEAGIWAVNQLMSLPTPPTAIITTDDEVAIGALRALQSRGIRVPQDVSLVGCDDTPVAAFADVPLTTLAQPAADVGEQIAELFLSALDNPEKIGGHSVRLPLSLIVRASTEKRHSSMSGT